MADQQSDSGPLASTTAGDTIPGTIYTLETLAIGASATGVVNTPGDDDWFRVQLQGGESYVFTLTGENVGGSSTLADPYLELYVETGGGFMPTGQLLTLDDDAGPGQNALLRFTPTQSGVYFINARAWEADSGATLTGGYRITADLGPPQDPLDTIDLGFKAIDNTITYYFATAGQSFGGETAVRTWSSSEMAAVTSAFATFAAVVPLTFTQAASSASADLVFVLADLESGTLGSFSGGATGGYLFFDPYVSGNWSPSALLPGGNGFVTLLHEIGHSLGLAHPHDNSGNSEIMQGVLDEFGSFGTYGLNQGVFTTMTYNQGWPVGALSNSSSGLQATPMALDIALLQQKYGAKSFNAGDNIYTLPTGAGAPFTAIWDTGGVDTIASTNPGGSAIDLRAATLLNDAGGGGYVSHNAIGNGGFTIAANVVIENARGWSGRDVVVGNHAANALYGLGGDDIMSGLGGNDWLEGGDGWDLLDGGDGDDTLVGGEDRDQLIGGAGIDTIVYNRATAGVELSLTVKLGRTGEATNDSFDGIENVVGSNYDDGLTGDTSNNFIYGLDGNDRLWGNEGEDILIGSAGADILTGGAGIDATSYHNSNSGVRVVLFQYTGRYGDAEGDLFGSIENIIGSPFQDEIFGDNANNELYGQAEIDVLEGDAGNDYLDGGAGADKIYGQDGNDTLFGGEGQDRLFGGAGADTFFYRNVSESLVGTPDEIVEFTRAHGDKISLSGIDANATIGGDQAFSFIDAAAFSGTAGELRYAGNFLEADVNGDSAADFQVQLNVASLQSSDFFL